MTEASAPAQPAAPLQDAPGRRPVARSTTVFEGAIFDVVREDVDFTAQVRFTREYLRHSGAVAVLALDEDENVLMIRQYRHPAGAELWEIPAGLLDVAGEDPVAAAARELAEETGHAASAYEPLVTLRPSPGCSDETIEVFLATGLHALAEDDYERTDEEAGILLRRVPLAEAATAALSGRITNATAVAAILAARARRA
ncbi:ADP-ribose pyrophosphatase [Brachybacterium phenoliresistens]|uniref:ADP-ribose pyrophosphatase n=1 Tax=Brachybacterium phenoliresistens TaxID=396014 RepID=Z9JY68_9MICO|nr:NUDIX hydrolase [Brachybacterium phenoliresistens]EWS82948.1 ADP-ribose pyrophosphatase [Brachybacterium phenoliresistens]